MRSSRLLCAVWCALALPSSTTAQHRALLVSAKAQQQALVKNAKVQPRGLFEGTTEADLLSLLPETDLDGDGLVQLDRGPRSEALGTPNHGRLRAGVRLPEHPGYVVRDRDRAWATDATVTTLVEGFEHVVTTDRGAPRIKVHDLSLPQGGPMHGHKSHQNGTDVDLAYYQRDCDGTCPLRPVSIDSLDAARQWRLLHYWLLRGQLRRAFVDYALQGPLYDAARESGASARQLQAWFQFPNGPSAPGLIRHVPGHHDHVHVRFRAARPDGGMTPSSPLPTGSLTTAQTPIPVWASESRLTQLMNAQAADTEASMAAWLAARPGAGQRLHEPTTEGAPR